MSKNRSNKRQMTRLDTAHVVVRSLLKYAELDHITVEDVGRIVARIIKNWPAYSERQIEQVKADWMAALASETKVTNMKRLNIKSSGQTKH
tara:strand:- start:2374 stop:2646 length:273 start_codon:yes stop_codon:yes gene_type:complete